MTTNSTLWDTTTGDFFVQRREVAVLIDLNTASLNVFEQGKQELLGEGKLVYFVADNMFSSCDERRWFRWKMHNRLMRRSENLHQSNEALLCAQNALNGKSEEPSLEGRLVFDCKLALKMVSKTLSET
ncbi:MAG: hypothetical protein D8M57_19455 [Candidatus Scalindua sp. AMX11]|nr:MAG: hypothetical protein DWQ00_03015 [Candidatus Scalindua sp.]NOG82218.1 hypothetical protein [Planctomycetota bacterium]RZV65500.1 MAG: hypothetical protein EX341_18005 [Candidatus Scalindua sp. SCAELEC01]TDE63225.1 MAG: hypothetical protein D8M57_19455 [Candidatus Scalindua sp. AMX11]NOG84180.1 hypothetical protein [Planctomycetota bacterium]